jgi:hypothetical protein
MVKLFKKIRGELMGLNSGLTAVFIGCGLSILSISQYFQHSTNHIYLLMTFFFLTGLITGLFELKQYHNKILYLMVLIVLLLIMWIMILTQPFLPNVNKMLIYAETGLVTLIVIFVFLFTVREWDKSKKIINSQ